MINRTTGRGEYGVNCPFKCGPRPQDTGLRDWCLSRRVLSLGHGGQGGGVKGSVGVVVCEVVGAGLDVIRKFIRSRDSE